MKTDFAEITSRPWLFSFVFSLILLLPPGLFAQCVSPELLMINSCIEHPNPNGSPVPVESEIIILRAGLVPVAVSDIGVDMPFNGFGAANEDLGVRSDGTPFGCVFKEPTVTAISGCPAAIALGPDGIIPANAFIVIFINGTTNTADASGTDFTNICASGQTLVILQSACNRTAGAFANGPGSGDPIRFITVSSPCGTRSFTYNTEEINPSQGTFFLVGPGASGNLDCDFPVIPDPCPGLDATFSICGAGSQVDPPILTDIFRAVYPTSVLSVSFHSSPAMAELNLNRIDTYGATTNSPDTLFARIIYADSLCVAVGRLVINFFAEPATTLTPAGPARGCDPDFDGLGTFKLRLLDAEIGNGQPVVYFADAQGTSRIDDPTNYVGSAGTIFAAAGLGSCMGELVSVQLELIDGPLNIATVEGNSCEGSGDGSITFQTTGFGPFSYNWANNAFDSLSAANGLSPGQYRLTVTDAWGCEDRLRPFVADGTATQVNCSEGQPASGSASADGVVNLTFSEGTPPYQLTYSGAAAGAVEVLGSSVQLTGLLPGDYTFTVTDADGCTSEACTLTLRFTDPLELICQVRNNTDGAAIGGSIGVTIIGGRPPFTATVANQTSGGTDTYPNLINGQQTFSNLSAADYRITLTDANGMVQNCSRTITTVPCPLTVVGIRQLVTDCSGRNNNVILLIIAGSQGNITTVWSGEPGVDIFNGQQEAGPLAPGVYFVMVSDGSGCPAVTEGPILVTDPGLTEFTLTGNFDVAPCHPDGSAEVTITSGGAAPYQLVLVNNTNGQELDRITGVTAGGNATFTGLQAGPAAPDYAVFVIDDVGCRTDSRPVPLTGGVAPLLTLPAAQQTIVPPLCPGDSTGSVTVMAEGGTTPYTYRWLEYPALQGGRMLANGDTQTDLPPGDYLIQITDGNGCLDTAALFLPDGVPPTLNCGPTMPQMGSTPATARLIIGAGLAPYTISLTTNGITVDYANRSAGDNTVTPLDAGDYIAVVTDANGCESEPCLFTVADLGCGFTINAQVDSISCTSTSFGQISLNPQGGTLPYTFDWASAPADDDNSIVVESPGDYSVTVTDGAGCVLDTIISVFRTVQFIDLVIESPVYLAACPGQDVRIPLSFSGNGPYRLMYTFDNAPAPAFQDTFVTNNMVDTLLLPAALITDGSGIFTFGRYFNDACDTRVFQSYSIQYSAQDTIRRFGTSCSAGPVVIGGRTFTPTMPSDTFQLINAEGCNERYEVDITFRAATIPDTIIVDVCPAVPYELNGEIFDANRPEGAVIFVPDGICDSTVWVRLVIAEEFLGNYGESVCVGDTVFYAGRFFTADNPSGLARLPGLAASGCDSLVIVNNSFRRTGDVRLFGNFEICPGDSVDLRFTYDGPGGINVLMTDAQGNRTNLDNIRDGNRVNIFPTVSTTYQLLSSAMGGCDGTVSGSSSVLINDIAGAAEVLLDPGNFCSDTLGKVSIDFSGGVGPFDIIWSNGPTDTVNRNLLPGTYRVVVTDAQGCTIIDSVTLNPRIPLNVAITGVGPDCVDGRGRLLIDTIVGGTGFYEISLDGTFFVPVADVATLTPILGNNRAYMQDAGDCVAEVNFFVPPALVITPDLVRDTTIFLGDSLFLDPGVIPLLDSAWWTPSPGLSNPNGRTTVARPLRSTTYTLHLRTVAQCLFTFDVNIVVDERLPIYAPTAFSPNGDEVNEVYQLGLGPGVRGIQTLSIFNHWGNLMYEGTDGWDGMFDGRRAEPAVYVYRAIIKMADGSERSVRGDFVLMR
jgi:gliding motility-associated-like protein